GLLRWFVAADARYAWKAHREPRLVTLRRMDRIEGDFEHEQFLDLAHRAEAIQRVVAHELVEPFQLLVGEARISLAHRQQLARVGPASEGIIRIEARTAPVAALRIHHHAVGS